jgi:branched-chain amino acid transport system permease protein
MIRFLQVVVDGIAFGAIYASLALALVLIFRSTGIINLAQGEMAMFSTYIAWQLVAWGFNMGLVFAITLAAGFIIGAGVQRTIIRPVQFSSHLTIVIVTLGLFLVFNSLAGFIWTFTVRSFPTPFPTGVWTVGQVRLVPHSVGTVGVLIVIMVLLYLLFRFTKIGLAMRAASANAESSRLVGIRVSSMLTLGWGMAAMLGAVAGILVAPRLFLDPFMMFGVLIFAFASASLGGFDSPHGAVVGGLIIGVTENLAGRYIPFIGADLKIAVALLIIFIVLLVRPSGLFGSREVVRV